MNKGVKLYHYTESGLDDVWLTNGYTLETIDDEEHLSIADADGLHRAIGQSLARRPTLTGAQFRYLRKEMDLSQVSLGRMLGVSVEAISLWERTGNISPMGQRLLQALYLERARGKSQIAKLLEEVAKVDGERFPLNLVFEATEGGWKEAA